MLVEKIIFSILAFYLFLLMFFKMIKKIDATYVAVLIMQGLGIAISFIEIIFSLRYNIIVKTIIYLISIVIPIIIVILERRGKSFSELIYLTLAKFYRLIRKYQKMQINFTLISRKKSRQLFSTQNACRSV